MLVFVRFNHLTDDRSFSYLDHLIGDNQTVGLSPNSSTLLLVFHRSHINYSRVTLIDSRPLVRFTKIRLLDRGQIIRKCFDDCFCPIGTSNWTLWT